MNRSAPLFTCYFDRVCVTMPAAAVVECSRPGQPADDAVAHWTPRIDWTGTDPESIRAELREYGAWTPEQLADDVANRERIVWIAAGVLSEEGYTRVLAWIGADDSVRCIRCARSGDPVYRDDDAPPELLTCTACGCRIRIGGDL